MDDPDLEAIRQRRMAEMMGKQGSGQMSAEQQEEQEEAKRAAEEQRHAMLVAVMMPEARERLARIALVKPDKARNIENMILNAAKRGAISEKVSEERLVGMLEQISEQDKQKTKITIQRRRPTWEDDD
eukprot:jgi/Chrzof1/12354/Cz06g31180.t1